MATQVIFQTLSELERHYKDLMNAEEDPLKKADIRADFADAKADFKIQQLELKQKQENESREAKLREEQEKRETEVRAREIKAWIREALVEFPEAKEFSELIKGETEDEIKASAKSTHDRVLAIRPATSSNPIVNQNQEELKKKAEEAYGAVTGSGGSGTPTVNEDPNWQFQVEYAQKYNDGRLGGRFGNEIMGVSPAETDRYVAKRGGQHLFDALARVQEIKYGSDSPLVNKLNR